MGFRQTLRVMVAPKRRGDYLLTILTLLLLLLMFIVVPLEAAGFEIFDVVGAFVAIAMIACVIMLSANVTATVLMVAAFGVSIWIIVLRLSGTPPSPDHVLATASAWILLVISLGWPVARAVFAPGDVNYHRIIGAILLYLLIAVAFSSLFVFVGFLIPGAFSGLTITDGPSLASQMIYFSVVTLTTVGYGDVLPVHPFARSLCNLESIIGQFYTATLLARLVTLHLESRHTNGAGKSHERPSK